jgi:hypothetical protein
MKHTLFILFSLIFILTITFSAGWALNEEGQTIIYKVTHHSSAGDLASYVAYSIAAKEQQAYWLQRTTHMQSPESQPLSITQTLLDGETHAPLRYIMHRPPNMGRPAVVVDLPVAEMGKDEIFPTPITNDFSDSGALQVAAGTFAVKTARIGEEFTVWASPDVPVLGVVKVEAPDWTMELFRIDPYAEDLLSPKPPQGGRVYLKEE